MGKFMRLKRKKIALWLVLAMVLSLGTGCENKETGETSSTPKESTEASETAQSQKEAGKMRGIPAQELVNEMAIGWNLGDTLDVCNADRDGDGQIDENAQEVDETLWGNGKTTKELFTHLKEEGINAVRIPVTWRDHMGEAPDYTIDQKWMDRVQEVVDYAYDQSMYVIINIHHDGGGDPDFGAWIRNASDSSQKEEILSKYRAVWTQIADRFQDYSDYLIFESMNEVGFDDLDRDEAYDLFNEFNQAFVDVIRNSQGNNPQRHLLIAGYWTDIDATCEAGFEMPEDTIEDHMMVSVHYYTPWQFCTTNQQNTWGTKEDVTFMQGQIDKMVKNFVKKGIPVIIGEYGFGENETASCVYFAENLTKYSHEKGIPAFLWDNKQMYNRQTMSWNIDGLGEALTRAVSGKDYKIKK